MHIFFLVKPFVFCFAFSKYKLFKVLRFVVRNEIQDLMFEKLRLQKDLESSERMKGSLVMEKLVSCFYGKNLCIFNV